MTYKASLKVQFDTEWTSTHYSSGYDDSMLPEEHYTFQVPAEKKNPTTVAIIIIAGERKNKRKNKN